MMLLLHPCLLCILSASNANNNGIIVNAFVPSAAINRPRFASSLSSWGNKRVGNQAGASATKKSVLLAAPTSDTTDTTTTTTTTTSSEVDKAYNVLQTELKLPTTSSTTTEEEEIKTLLSTNPPLVSALLADANTIGYCAMMEEENGVQNTADMDLFFDYYNDICLTDDDDDDDEEGKMEGSKSTIARLQKLAGPIHSHKLMNMMKRHPSLMASVLLSDGIRSTEALLRLKLNLTPSQYNKIIKLTTTSSTNTTKASNVLSRLNRSTLRSFLSFFSNTVSLSPIQLQRLLVSRPQLLSYSIPNLSSTYNYFYRDITLTKDEIIKLITSMPTAFTYGLESRIKPNVEFVRKEVGGKNWRKVIYGYPQIFRHSVDGVLRPKVDYFYETLKLERKSDVSTIVSKFPPTLWLSPSNLQSKLDFLQSSLDLSEEDLRYMILSYPQVLGLSLEDNLKPKIDYLLASPSDGGDEGEGALDQQQEVLEESNKDMDNETAANDDDDETTTISPPIQGGAGLTRDELKEFVLYQPALLAYSLEKRIRPRIEKMTENGIRFSYAPPHLMSMTDVKFNEWLNKQISTWSIG